MYPIYTVIKVWEHDLNTLLNEKYSWDSFVMKNDLNCYNLEFQQNVFKSKILKDLKYVFCLFMLIYIYLCRKIFALYIYTLNEITERINFQFLILKFHSQL